MATRRLRRLIARPLINIAVAGVLLLMGWGVTALPGDSLEAGAILGAVGAVFAMAAVLVLALGLLGFILKWVKS